MATTIAAGPPPPSAGAAGGEAGGSAAERYADVAGLIGRQVVRRLLLFVPTVVIVLVAVSLLASVVPGDPAVAALGEGASPGALAAYRTRIGLDRPLLRQMWEYISGLVQGDLGVSAATREPVLDAIRSRVGVTISLVAATLAIGALLGIGFGVAAGLRPNRGLDRVVNACSSAGVALPDFWFALLLSYFVGIRMGWLPPSGFVSLGDDVGEFARHIILPALALAVAPASELCRQTRASVIDVARQDFVRTARASGLRRRSVIGRHVLKNAAIPVVTVLALQLPRLIGSAALVETVFNFQGVGSLGVSAALASDIVTVQGIVACVAVVVLGANLVADISYQFLDPRLRRR